MVGRLRFRHQSLQEAQVSLVGLEGGIEEVAQAGNGANQRLHDDIGQHPAHHRPGRAESQALHQEDGGREGAREIPEAGDQSHQRVYTETEIRAGNPELAVQDPGQAAEPLQLGTGGMDNAGRWGGHSGNSSRRMP